MRHLSRRARIRARRQGQPEQLHRARLAVPEGVGEDLGAGGRVGVDQVVSEEGGVQLQFGGVPSGHGCGAFLVLQQGKGMCCRDPVHSGGLLSVRAALCVHPW